MTAVLSEETKLRDEIVTLLLRQWPDFLATQHQEQFRRFLELFGRVLRLAKRFPGNDRPVIGEQDGVTVASTLPHRLRQSGIAWREIRSHRQFSHPHDVISRQWRKKILRVQSFDEADRDGIRRVKVNDR